jgi:hypothetical protein
MVNVLSNLSIVMCHAFIKDQSLMPWGVYVSNSKSNEQPMVNIQDIAEE